MSLLMWNPICDSLLYYLLEKRCPALAKQFKELFFPQHIDVTNDDLTHLVDYFSKPSKKRGLSSKVDDPVGKKLRLEKTTDKHEESETPNSLATLQERETGKVTGAVLESSTDSSSDDDDTPVIVTPVKKPAAPVVQLSSGSSSSSSDSDSEEETSSQNSSSKSQEKSQKNYQHSLNSQTPTSPSASSATNRCDFSARHTCQASPIPSTSSHDQGKALKAPTDHNVRKNKNIHQDTKLNKSTDPTLCSAKSSENATVRKSNLSHKSDSFFDRLMGASFLPQVQSTPQSVISQAGSRLTPKSVISPASSQPTPKSVISPACSQPTPKSVISPACSQPTPKSVISPACSQSTPRLCRYGMDCRRRLAGDCQFTHTSIRKESEERRVGPGGRRICRYGGDCRRMLYCNYDHVL